MNNKLIKNNILLIMGAIITKLIGMIIKIILARNLGPKGLGLYMMLLPTYILLINISQLSIPLTITKLISDNNKNNKTILFSITPLIIILNIIILIIVILLAPIISNNLIKQQDTYPSIIIIALTLPFITISSICRSYFIGKEKITPHIISNITEETIKLLIIILLKDILQEIKIKYAVCIILSISIITEIISTIILILFLPKNIKITKKDLVPNKLYIKESLKISIPNTTNTLLSNINYFIEPIILTNLLLNNGYTNNYILKEYGIITGLIIPLLTLPSFIIIELQKTLLTKLSKEHNTNKIKYLLYINILINIIIYIPFLIIYFIFPKIPLNILYKTTTGYKYLKILSPFYFLSTIITPFNTLFISTNNNIINLKINILTTIIKILSLILLSYFNIGIYTLILSDIFIIIITILFQFKYFHKI